MVVSAKGHSHSQSRQSRVRFNRTFVQTLNLFLTINLVSKGGDSNCIILTNKQINAQHPKYTTTSNVRRLVDIPLNVRRIDSVTALTWPYYSGEPLHISSTSTARAAVSREYSRVRGVTLTPRQTLHDLFTSLHGSLISVCCEDCDKLVKIELYTKKTGNLSQSVLLWEANSWENLKH